MIAQKQKHTSILLADSDESLLHTLQGDELKQAVNAMKTEILEKVITRQNKVATGCDNNLLALAGRLQQLDKNLPWEENIRQLCNKGEELREALQLLQHFLRRRGQNRLVSFHERFTITPEGPRSGSDIGLYEAVMSQGVSECMQWKGIPIFKTVYDFSLYSMLLWNLKPKTIIELGSGMGASAIWMADLLKTFENEGHVYSVDLKKPELKHQGVSYVEGNCLEIERVFEDNFLGSLPHPWLLIEDAHVNLYGVLCHFHPYIQEGDYVVIEDTKGKYDATDKFMREHPNCYQVDTYYTDFFGRNATCAHDSIFARIV